MLLLWASVLNHNTQATNEHDFYVTLLLSGDNKSCTVAADFKSQTQCTNVDGLIY